MKFRINSIQFKYVFPLLFLSAIVYIANILFAFKFTKENAILSADRTASQVELMALTTHASNSLHAVNAAINKLQIESGKKDKRTLINIKEQYVSSSQALSMYMDALMWGSESDIFREMRDGKSFGLWKELGYESKYTAGQPDSELLQIMAEADIFLSSASDDIRELFDLAAEKDQRKASDERIDILAGKISGKNETVQALFIKAIGQINQNAMAEIRNESFAMEKIMNVSLISSVLGAVAAIAMGIFYSYVFLVRPLDELAVNAGKIASGNYDQKLTLGSSGDEMGVLKSSMNTMAEKLNVDAQSLREDVATQTKQLSDEKKRLELFNRNLEKTIEEKTAELKRSKDLLQQKVEEQTAQLSEKVENLEKMNAMMVGREKKMIELKEEIQSLKEQRKS